MKIFLPAGYHGGQGSGKGEHAKPPVKPIHPPKGEHKPTPPVTKPVEPKPTPPVPKPVEPKPTPPVQKPVHPKPIPPVVKPTPPVQKPTPPVVKPTPPKPPVAPAPPVAPPMPPQMPMQPCVQPIFAIPCGWMPIFDADCYPFMHPGQIQHVPMPAAPTPVPRPQVKIEETFIESPGPVPMPEQERSSMPYGWKLLESPELEFEESPLLTIPTPQIEQEYMAEIESPMQMEQYQPYATGCHLCGCNPCNCMPTGGFHPMPMHMPMQAPMNFCNACSQPIRPMPFHMMPYSHQGHNWPGSY